MELIEGSETSAYINQTPGNYPKGNLLYSVHGEGLKSRIEVTILCCVKSQNSEVSWVLLHRRHPVLQFAKTNCLKNLTVHIIRAPILVTSQSKAFVCGRSLAGIARSNTPVGMDVSLLWVLCVFRNMSLRRADHSSRGVLPSVVCLSVTTESQ